MDELRDARILIAGEYPDKDLTLTEQDLDAIVAAHEPVPLLVEHKPTLKLGLVESLYRKGRELWGKVRLLPEAAKLIAQSGVRTLSAGLLRNPLKLREVSLVSYPRIPEASLMSEERVELPIGEVMLMQETTQVATQPETPPPPAPNPELEALRAENEQLKAQLAEMSREQSARESEWQRRVQAIERQLAEREASMRVSEWQARYGLTPAQAEIAKQILLAQHVELSADKTPAQLFAQFVETLPVKQGEPVKTVRFGEDLSATVQALRKAGFEVGDQLTPEAQALLTEMWGGARNDAF